MKSWCEYIWLTTSVDCCSIAFCKPCFVPLYYKRLATSYSGGNYLSTKCMHFVLPSVQFLQESSPTIIWVSRSWGLPRSTLIISNETSSLWHFQSIQAISYKDLGFFLAVSSYATLAYDFTRHEHYKHLSLCEHGLSSTSSKRCSNYPNAIDYDLSNYNKNRS